MKIKQLGLIDAAHYAEILQPLVKLNPWGDHEIKSVAVGPVETEEDVDELAAKLKACIRGEDLKWKGHKLRFSLVVMHLGGEGCQSPTTC